MPTHVRDASLPIHLVTRHHNYLQGSRFNAFGKCVLPEEQYLYLVPLFSLLVANVKVDVSFLSSVLQTLFCGVEALQGVRIPEKGRDCVSESKACMCLELTNK